MTPQPTNTPSMRTIETTLETDQGQATIMSLQTLNQNGQWTTLTSWGQAE